MKSIVIMYYITMNGAYTSVLVCTGWYAAYRSVLQIIIRLSIHHVIMAVIMWIRQGKQKPKKIFRSSKMTLLLIEILEGSGKKKSHVTLILVFLIPF